MEKIMERDRAFRLCFSGARFVSEIFTFFQSKIISDCRLIRRRKACASKLIKKRGIGIVRAALCCAEWIIPGHDK